MKSDPTALRLARACRARSVRYLGGRRRWGRAPASAPARAEAPRIDNLILVFKTHFDLGYTAPMDEVLESYRTTMIDPPWISATPPAPTRRPAVRLDHPGLADGPHAG